MIFSNIFFSSSTTYRLYFRIRRNTNLCTTTTLGTQYWPLSTGGRCSEIIYVPNVTRKWGTLWTVGRYKQLDIMDSWSLWTVGRYRHVVAIRRWSLSQV